MKVSRVDHPNATCPQKPWRCQVHSLLHTVQNLIMDNHWRIRQSVVEQVPKLVPTSAATSGPGSLGFSVGIFRWDFSWQTHVSSGKLSLSTSPMNFGPSPASLAWRCSSRSWRHSWVAEISVVPPCLSAKDSHDAKICFNWSDWIARDFALEVGV